MPYCYHSSTYIAERSECVTDVSHGVVGEGDEGEVSWEGVPPGGKGGLSQPVPEDSHSLPLSPKHRQRNRNDKASLFVTDAFDSTMWQNFRFHSSCCHQINSCFLQTRSCFVFHWELHTTLHINALCASGHIQSSYNLYAVLCKWQLCCIELFSPAAFIPVIT